VNLFNYIYFIKQIYTMSNLKKNKCRIYKNDLKFNETIDLETTEFDSDAVKSIYNNFKNKPKIELRIEDSIMKIINTLIYRN